jgi:hypothetical protein
VEKYLITLIIGLVIGYFLFGKEAEPIINTITETKTDTVFITKKDTIYIKSKEIHHTFLRDTVIIDFDPKINLFTSSKPFLYGNVSVSGEVLGEVLKIDIFTDLKIPQITNTITTTNTIMKKPSGFYLTAGINKQLTPNVGLTYVRDRVMIGVTTQDVKVGVKIF